MVVAEIKLKLKAYTDQAGRPSHKYNVTCMKEEANSQEFKIELNNRFSLLSQLPEETLDDHWNGLQEVWTTTCNEVLGKKKRKHK